MNYKSLDSYVIFASGLARESLVYDSTRRGCDSSKPYRGGSRGRGGSLGSNEPHFSLT